MYGSPPTDEEERVRKLEQLADRLEDRILKTELANLKARQEINLFRSGFGR